MYAAIDRYVDKFNKGVVATRQGGYEDPTYIGFKLIFNFSPEYRNPSSNETDDALFATKPGLDSAQDYLRRIGHPNRAQMLDVFKRNLQYLVDQTPWYFQSVEGMADIWRIYDADGEYNSYRGKDKFLTFTCLESIDMRMTALADLYRKATFDAYNMREILPENLRWFTLTLAVVEIRSFQRVRLQQLSSFLTAAGVPGAGGLGTGSDADSSVYTGADVGKQDFADFEHLNDLISVLQFDFSHCEFDFNDSFPSDGTLNMGAGDPTMAKQRMRIRTRRIKEHHTYKLLDLVLKDGVDEASHVRSGLVETSTGKNGLPGTPDFGKAYNPRTPYNPISSAVNNLKSSLQNKLERAGADFVAGAANQLDTAVKGMIIGNVYDLRNQTIETILGDFLGKNEQTAAHPLRPGEDVYPKVPGTDVTTKSVPGGIIGNAIGDVQPQAAVQSIGNAYPDASAITPPPPPSGDVYPGVPGADTTTATASGLGSVITPGTPTPPPGQLGNVQTG